MICETCLVEVASFRGAWQCNICGAAGAIPVDPLRSRRVSIGRRLISATGKFERGCRLLTEEARKQLKTRDAQRTRTISEALDLATKTVCEFPKESFLSDRPQAEIVDFSQLSFFRQKLIETVANEARDGVREFSNALLRSQGRVGSEAGLLRTYTALVIRDLREWLNSSILFRDEPLDDWQNDTIARETIRCCESIVAERGLLGDHWPYGTEQSTERDSGTWPAGIMEWEAHKDPDDVHPNRDERLSEFALRSVLSSQLRVAPRDVPNKQIWEAASDSCQHYGPILIVPNGAGRPPMEAPRPIASADFWSEREKEFRKYSAGENSSLEALWSFPGSWQFLDDLRGDDGFPTTRCTQVFKSLAREARKGFSGHQSGESWIDWLDAMRRADYGERSRYSPVVYTGKAIQTSSVLRELIPDEWMVRLVPKSKDLIIADDSVLRPTAVMDRVDIQRAKDVVLVMIEHIFNASADFCLELRSRTEEAHGQGANTPRPVQGPSHAGPIQTGPPARHEIKTLADETFSVTGDRLLIAEGGATPSTLTGHRGDSASVTTANVPGTPTSEGDVGATAPLTPDAKARVAAERAELLRAFKAKGKAQGIKITDKMVAQAADPNWNERSMVQWWKRNYEKGCKLRHDRKIRAVLQKEPSTIWPNAS